MKHYTVNDLAKDILGENKGNIAICNSYFSDAGVGIVMKQQAMDLIDEGHHVTLFVFGADSKPPKDADTKILGSPNIKYLKPIYRLIYPLNPISLIKSINMLRKYDFIISHQYPFTLLAYLTRLFFGVKYAHWHHHSLETDYTDSLIEKINSKLTQRLNEKSWFIKKADYVCSVSGYSKRLLKERGKVDSIVVPNKVDQALKEVSSRRHIEEVKNKYSLDKDNSIVLFVGPIAYRKNIHKLTEVFKKVNNSLNDTVLVIVGKIKSNKYFNDLKNIASNNVVFTGFVPHDELAAFYSTCDVYATCSLAESFDLALAEAQSFGKPVVCFDIPAHREVVENGYLVREGDYEEFKDRVIELIEKKKKKQKNQ